MYSVNINSSTKKIFDQFSKQNNSMKIENSIKIELDDDSIYYLCPIIEKILYKNYSNYFHSGVSISEYKKYSKHIFHHSLKNKTFDELWNIQIPDLTIATYRFFLYFKNDLEQRIKSKLEIKEQDIFKLNKPISINAQTSNDTDYSWDGNQYGDTSTFYITSYEIKWIYKRRY